MNDDGSIALHLNAIRSAIAALALAVIAATFLSAGNDQIGLVFILGSILLVVYSFVPTLSYSYS